MGRGEGVVCDGRPGDGPVDLQVQPEQQQHREQACRRGGDNKNKCLAWQSETLCKV